MYIIQVENKYISPINYPTHLRSLIERRLQNVKSTSTSLIITNQYNNHNFKTYIDIRLDIVNDNGDNFINCEELVNALSLVAANKTLYFKQENLYQLYIYVRENKTGVNVQPILINIPANILTSKEFNIFERLGVCVEANNTLKGLLSPMELLYLNQFYLCGCLSTIVEDTGTIQTKRRKDQTCLLNSIVNTLLGLEYINKEFEKEIVNQLIYKNVLKKIGNDVYMTEFIYNIFDAGQ